MDNKISNTSKALNFAQGFQIQKDDSKSRAALKFVQGSTLKSATAVFGLLEGVISKDAREAAKSAFYALNTPYKADKKTTGWFKKTTEVIEGPKVTDLVKEKIQNNPKMVIGAVTLAASAVALYCFGPSIYAYAFSSPEIPPSFTQPQCQLPPYYFAQPELQMCDKEVSQYFERIEDITDRIFISFTRPNLEHTYQWVKNDVKIGNELLPKVEGTTYHDLAKKWIQQGENFLAKELTKRTEKVNHHFPNPFSQTALTDEPSKLKEVINIHTKVENDLIKSTSRFINTINKKMVNLKSPISIKTISVNLEKLKAKLPELLGLPQYDEAEEVIKKATRFLESK